MTLLYRRDFDLLMTRRVLRPLATLFYAEHNLGFASKHNMQRLTARLLLLFALAGTFVPVAMQALAAPPHACCLRKAVHRCHAPGASQDPVASDAGCCHRDCCRAVTTAQWANLESSLNSSATQRAANYETVSRTPAPTKELLTSRSTRAPPQSPIA